MPRPVTLFTGQWADLPLEKLAPLAKKMGYDGVELACWGDHFEVDKALSSKGYVQDKWDLLRANGLTCQAVSNHLVGQAVCDLIDERHQLHPPPGRLGRRQARGRAASARREADRDREGRPEVLRRPPGQAGRPGDFPAVVNGFTGSSIWHSIYAFPPTSQEYWENGFQDFAQAVRPDPRGLRGQRTSTSAWRSTRPRSPSTSRAPSARSTRSRATGASASTTTPRTWATRASTT